MAKLSLRREHFMYSYNKFPPQNLTFQIHHYYEILFFTQGDAKYIIDGNEYDANPGDVFITKPNELHSIVFKESSTYERHFVQFDVDFLSALSSSLPERFSSAAEKHKISAADVQKYGIDKFFLSIQDCMIKHPTEFELIIQTHILRMAAAICDCMSVTYELPVTGTTKTQKIKQYINKNFTRNLTLDEIADEVFFNKYYMCHLFKTETGMTIKEYIELLRFMYARKLYAQGKKMSDISSLCGYSDYSLFYKNFTKYSGGKSPKSFFKTNTHDDTST
ncbi:MAG: helix-turn-helix transcriptional regulator [Oscillospiraceae bacterium]|nr:helix-turn-helix transcriptional regulator [Oscillospiraceae bacterium]